MYDLQAARGTSLSPKRAAFAVAGLVLLTDQLAKAAALAMLEPGERVDVIPGLIDLTVQRNAGAALGAGAGYTVVLSVIAIAVVVVVGRMATRLRDGVWAIGLGLLLGGALGNLADRLVRSPGVLRGEVIDFINYRGLFVGNLADIALTFAAVGIIVQSWRGIGVDGVRQSRP